MTRWVTRRVLTPLRNQISRGATPEGLALSLALGASLGLFPVLGATTALCLLAGVALRLNHAGLQLGNYLAAAFQLPLILAFVRLGEGLVGASPARFSIAVLTSQLQSDPAGFVARWGTTGLHGILGWSLVAPVLAWGLYTLLVPVMRALATRFQRPGPAAAAA